MFEHEVEKEAAECGGGKTTSCWRWREEVEDCESEGEEAANAGSGRERAGGGDAVSPHGGLHNVFEVASRCFASAFQDLQAVR